MSSAEVASVVAGIAAAGSIGAVAVGFLRLRLERELADRSDARTVLAGAARELWRMKQTMRDQLGPMTEGMRSGQKPDGFPARIGKLEARRDAVEGELDVLRIRFPEDRDIIVSYAAAFQSVRHLISVYMAADWSGSGRIDSAREAGTVSEEFDGHRNAFLASAQRVAGAKLGDIGS